LLALTWVAFGFWLTPVCRLQFNGLQIKISWLQLNLLFNKGKCEPFNGRQPKCNQAAELGPRILVFQLSSDLFPIMQNWEGNYYSACCI